MAGAGGYLSVAKSKLWSTLPPTDSSHSPNYAAVTHRKIRRKSNFVHVGIEFTLGQTHVYIEGSPAET